MRIVSIGRLHWKKGYEHGLDAVSALRGQGIHVEHRIIGSGELLGAVAFWRHQLGLDEVVELCGSLPPARVAEHLRWADVLLHPATSEGFCNAVIEAQAHAVPVVCSDADGLSENIEHGVTGFVTRRRQPLDLADAIEQLANDPELRARMGAAGRARVERRFRMDDHLDAWERFYRDALERRSTGRM